MITVLMATYQGARYIREQIDSILVQTVPGIQVLVSDDHSEDGTAQIIKEYEIQYPAQVTSLHFDTPSGGAAANFSRLFRQVSTGYVMLSDQDDIWFPDKTEKLLAKMKALEAEFGQEMPILVHSDMEVVDEQGNQIHPSFFQFQHVILERSSLNQLLVENNVTGAAAMVNAAMLPYLQTIPADCPMHDWWMALVACCVGKIGYVEEPLYCYRQHGTNTLGAKTQVQQYMTRINRSQKVQENYKKMFLQAAQLQEQFAGTLIPEQKQCLQAFLSLPEMSRIGKIRLIRKYRFYKSSWLNTVGMCFTV